MFSLDANILFYAADKAAGPRHAVARQIVQDAAGPRAAIGEQALFEFYHSTARKGRIPASEAAIIIGDLARNFTLMLAHQTIVEDALELVSQYRLSIWDARLLAVCAAHKCHTLLSEDMQDRGIYNGVRVINPFVSMNAGTVRELLVS